MSKMRLMFLLRLMFVLGLSVLTVGLVIATTIGIDSCESFLKFPPVDFPKVSLQPSTQPPTVGLEGTWVLKCYGEPGKLRLLYPRGILCGGYITLTLSAKATAGQIGAYPARDYAITTNAGVNRCFGKYKVEGNKFIEYAVHGGEKRAAHLSCWEMGGPSHLLAQEDQYCHILCSAQTYEITNCILIISSEKEVLVFTRKE